ncbi:MAG: ribulose-phosphate 3-epimerase [Gemmatimonas sp.]|nr:ribulose-phosphate 3-epimerase [Gemmatimonas sp.]
MTRVRIAPSILTADLGRLAEQITEAQEGGADWIHLDVMDGHFVPNITIGPLIAAAARAATSLPIDAHLMIEQPERYIGAFRDAGVDLLTVHVEACPHLHRTIQSIHETGAKAGVAVNPGTPVESIREILPSVDLVLMMSVNPGFGSQRFIEQSLAKIRRVRQMLEDVGQEEVELQVDGGVGESNIAQVVDAGATVVVAGSAVYNPQRSVRENIARLRRAAEG